MTACPAASACSTRAAATSKVAAAIVRAWRRNHMRISAAIWSLRERPALSFPPSSSPAISKSPRSRAVASSSSPSIGTNAPLSTRRCNSSRADSMRSNSSVVSNPARPSARAWAREPAISSSASRQSNWVDLLNRANSGEGPDENRPPHKAMDASCCCCSLITGFLVSIQVIRIYLG